jgi:hypothetical protein
LRRADSSPPLRVLQGGRKPAPIRAGVLIGLVAWLAIIVAAVLLYFAIALVRAAAAEASSSAPLTRSTIAFWDRVAQCETGSDWRGLGSTYQGGLGIYASTWDSWATELGLEARYPDAGDAPRLVQIRVADYGRRVHRGYWGCL